MSGSNGHDPAKAPARKVPVPVPVKRDEHRMGHCDRCGGETIHRKTPRGWECVECS